jgi:hypothetical protein
MTEKRLTFQCRPMRGVRVMPEMKASEMPA